ncbi:sce7726 family protein [Candidatus Nomurabacteria bacterium]|nr:sce7726 family protein [Candidatus Nomurabacteria bacterium]
MTTNDKIIRKALREVLKKEIGNYKSEKKLPAEIFEEFGVSHGTARIDFAIINGVMHGYEIKSDRDTLDRLPEQMKQYNTVFDKMTLVVGKKHLYHAVNTVPSWWGITLVKIEENKIIFQTIRENGENQDQVDVSIARLLWREEALKILEEKNKAKGFRSKNRNIIYEKLVDVLDINTLKDYVRNILVSRRGWRSDEIPMLYGG